jgi:signal transduction histidine kinase
MTAIPTTDERPQSLSAAHSATQSVPTIGIWVAGIALAIALVIAGIALTQAVAWRAQPFLGVMFTRTLFIDATRSIGSEWGGLNAGLQRGDQIIALQGRTLYTDPADFSGAMAALREVLGNQSVGDTIQVTFLRPAPDNQMPQTASGINCTLPGDGFAHCIANVQLIELPNNDFAVLFVIPFIAGLITLGIGAAVLILRHQQRSAHLVAFICALLAIFSTGLFDLNTSYTVAPVWIAATALLGGATLALALTFPSKLAAIYHAPRLFYAPFAFALLPIIIGLTVYFAPPSADSALLAFQPSVLTVVIATCVACALWIRQRQKATTPVMRDQANLILGGFAFALVVGIIYVINVVARSITGGVELIPLNTSAVAPFFMLPAFSMAYASLQTRAINADQWISKGITYTFLALGLVLGYFMLVYAATLVTGQMVSASNPLLLAIVVFVIAVAFVPVRTRLQALIDKVYFRQRVNYGNQVEQFARNLSALRVLPAISAEYRTTLENALAPSHTFIFLPEMGAGDYTAVGRERPDTDIRFSPASPLIQYLRQHEGLVYLDSQTPWTRELVAERARLLVLNPLVIVGFRGSSRLSGFAIIGAPRSGAGNYSYDEQRFIENLTNQMTVAVERAQVVESLERRVKELDILSRISQAVNYTGDYDSLLELIGTQTSKLVGATHVYVALRDAAMNELYYAFFLENNERYNEKENLRWQIDKDLVSEVVRTSQSLRTVSYRRAMNERGAAAGAEDPNLQAWLGVPLITGSRVLGVLAVGNTETNRPFGEEQMRQLQDVGALAATSLDKARLFNEANLRARQLAALNEISRRLVATELNLDNLLALITKSAVEILNAEAGVLLLTADDASGDLEYKVDIGSPDVELVGKRVPKGERLVGEVARTGTIVLANDVAHDPRWSGEAKATGFAVRNLLAVPLITQNRVIGVVEIMNRQRGGFSREDSDLLSAFAGQAAVAIENARLFELTDQQLQDRLDELEMMERIDAEMNRSLDLANVAEIALRYAITTTEATAGVIGLVDEEAHKLRIVAQIGYSELDMPEGADAVNFPLDRGIASRALKTQRAELVSDVSIDPMYVPSLRNARSQITVPMLSGGDVSALLVLESNQEGVLHLADMPFVQRLAEHASIAIANAQLYQQLVAANQSKSEFVGFVAHELKNPLTSVKGFADLLIANAVGTLTDGQRQAITTIRTNAERMNTLVSDLNDVTKLQTNNLRIDPEPIDFVKLIEETLRPLQKQIDDKGQQVVLELADKLPPVLADHNRIIQVMTNLLSNAHKYSPADGTITINASIQPPQRDSRGQVTKPMLRVAVRDQGIGMSQEDLKRLFTPYFRSDNPIAREQPGTGLGLTITRGIIEQHGGEVQVDSTLGEGTSFSFTLPLTQ